MSVRGILLAATAILVATCGGSAQDRDLQHELLQYLKNNITNYSPLLRPTINAYKPTYITMDTSLTQLVSVDSAKQSVKIGAVLMAGWTEERLVWDPAKFGNLTVINWDNSNVWFPVILIYNGIGDNQMLTPQMPVYLMSIRPNLTKVVAGWRREFEFSCEFDVSKFPIDKHVCELEFFFSDQGHNNKMLIPFKNNMKPFQIDGLYRTNSEWKLVNASTSSERKPYKLVQGAPDVLLPTYVIRLEIERVSAYYFMNIITPLLLLTLLQVLVYFVPLESGEKLGFGITIMLSYTVFLLLLDSIVPKSQTTPAIASFITAAMILSTISLLLTSLIMRLHFAPEGNRMPACMRAVLIGFLARVFCVGGAAKIHKVDGAEDVEIKNETSIDKKNATDEEDTPVVRSDWVVAAHAVERLMVAMGVAATAAIIGAFVIQPYT